MVERAPRGRTPLRTVALVSRAALARAVVTGSAPSRVLPVLKAWTLDRYRRPRRCVLRASVPILRSPPLDFVVESFLPPCGVLGLALEFEALSRIAVIAAGAPPLGTVLALVASGASGVLG